VLPKLEEIRKRRRKLGLTQKALAKIVGISQSTIAKIETGKMIPNYNLAKKIFEKLEEMEYREEEKAKDVMSSPVIFVKPEDKVEKAKELLVRHKISQMPVIEKGRVVGRVNEKLILMKNGEKCKEIMDLPYPIVNEETPVGVVKEILKREEMVVVVGKDGNIKGVITRSDLIKL